MAKLYQIASKCEYIADNIRAIQADPSRITGSITEDALFTDIYRQLCNIADTIDEFNPIWDCDDDE